MLRRFQSQTVILMYHRVTKVAQDPWGLCVSPEHFRQQMQVLSREACCRLDRAEAGGWAWNGSRTFVVTFDDGYADNLHNAAPTLERYGIPATFFISTGGIDAAFEFWWDELERIVFEIDDPARLAASSLDWDDPLAASADRSRESIHLALYQRLQPLSPADRQIAMNDLHVQAGMQHRLRESHRAMTTEELHTLAGNSLFEIGAHTVTHPMLATQTPELQAGEVRGSKQELERLLDRRITSFSYPYGGTDHYSAVTVDAVAEAGFERACTTSGAPVRRKDSVFEWGRLQVPDVDGDAFHRFLHA